MMKIGKCQVQVDLQMLIKNLYRDRPSKIRNKQIKEGKIIKGQTLQAGRKEISIELKQIL